MMKTILKHAAAVLLGAVILDLFCAWYYNPAPYQRAEGRVTDKVRRPNAWTSQAKEGFGVHHLDENGYNNPPDAHGDGISVLMMGSSHTEAYNVPAGAGAAERLEALLRADGRPGRVYNIGVSSHTFPRNAANMPRALARFAPADYVVIETDSVVFHSGTVFAAMDDRMDRLDLQGQELPAIISDRPLVKRLYRQYQALSTSQAGDDEDVRRVELEDIPPELLERYDAALREWFARLNAQAAEAGVRLIVYYHPALTPQPDGALLSDAQPDCLRVFREACADAGILFIDMTDAFTRAYEQRHVLPAGFANTALGAGHLNREGHRLVAEEIYRAIREAEAEA